MSLLYLVLSDVSICYPSLRGKFFTRYSPVRHDTFYRSRSSHRLACVKHSVSVHPEPGSNSSFNIHLFYTTLFFLFLNLAFVSSSSIFIVLCVISFLLLTRNILPNLAYFVNAFFYLFSFF